MHSYVCIYSVLLSSRLIMTGKEFFIGASDSQFTRASFGAPCWVNGQERCQEVCAGYGSSIRFEFEFELARHLDFSNSHLGWFIESQHGIQRNLNYSYVRLKAAFAAAAAFRV